MNDRPKDAGRVAPSASARDGDADAARREHLNRVTSQAALGDQAAFAELYRLSAAHLFGVIVRMVHDHGEAEDLLQDVYTAAWRRIDAFDPARGGAMTWLVTLARNRTIDRLRQHRDAQLDDEHRLTVPDDAPTPAALAEGVSSANASSAASSGSIRTTAARCARRSSAVRPTVSWPRNCACRSEP